VYGRPLFVILNDHVAPSHSLNVTKLAVSSFFKF
jgi:hypothetical protein